MTVQNATAHDLIVVGGGPGGYVAAIRGSQLGMKTALVEEDALGGVCLNWGCIPTKAILRSAEQFEAVRKGVPGLIVSGLEADYGAVIDASRKVAGRLSKGVAALMRKNKIEVIRGRGRLAGPGQVIVSGEDGERALEGGKIVLATGSAEFVFDGIDVDGERVLTSREALECRELPESLVVIGAGAVGLEFAYAYNAYGSDVTVVEMQDQVLPGFDREIADALAQSFGRRGVEVRTATAYKGLERSRSGVTVAVEGEKGDEELAASHMLLAVGRRARTEGIGLEECGVEIERGFIRVGPDLQTSVPGVYAIGDCNGPPLLAHAASHEGVAAVEFMAGERTQPLNPLHVPGNIYCQPQVGTIGWSEAQAREAGREVASGKVPFVASGKAVGTGHTEGFVKVVADPTYGEILGCQIIGHGATEMINEIALAMTSECTVREVAETCHAHPTLSEILMEAALAVEGRSINF